MIDVLINLDNETEFKPDFDIVRTADKVVGMVLEKEFFPHDAEVDLLITDAETVKDINSDYRDIDKTTDVLSFPNVSYDRAGDFSVIESEQKIDLLDPDTGDIMFGDIVINEDRVRLQARDYGHSIKREFAFLLAHSMLHLCGYDHIDEKEAAIMEKKQESVLEKLGITRD